MRKGAMLGAIGATAATLAFASAASANPVRHLHQRELAAVARYASGDPSYNAGNRRMVAGFVTGCAVHGDRRRQEQCTVTFPLYLDPSGELFGYDTATVRAYPDAGQIVLVRVGGWTLSQVAPGLVITGAP